MNWLIWLAGFFSLLAFYPYIHSILQHKTKPHFVTWFIWTLIGTLIALSYYEAGAPPIALIVPVIYALGPLVIAILALKYGVLGFNRFDICCLLSAIIALILWIVTEDPLLALGLNMGVEFLGTLPTLRKVYYYPKSENLTAWILFLLGNALNLAGLPIWSFVVLSYPSYLFIMSSVVTGLIAWGLYRVR